MTIVKSSGTSWSASQRAAQSGFTLVEILVATTILALLLGVLFATFYTTVRAWDRADLYSMESNDIEAVQKFLRSRIGAAKPVRYPDVTRDTNPGDLRIAFLGEANRMTFVAPLPAYRSSGGLYLFVIELSGGHLRMHYRPFHPRMASLRPNQEQPWTSMTLLQDVAAIQFRYLGQPHNETGFGWHTAWPEAIRPPLLLEIQLERSDPSALPWPMLAIRTNIENISERNLTQPAPGTALSGIR